MPGPNPRGSIYSVLFSLHCCGCCSFDGPILFLSLRVGLPHCGKPLAVPHRMPARRASLLPASCLDLIGDVFIQTYHRRNLHQQTSLPSPSITLRQHHSFFPRQGFTFGTLVLEIKPGISVPPKKSENCSVLPFSPSRQV